METGKIIATSRETKGWSQTDLANNSKVSRVMVGIYERGEAVPSIDSAKKVSFSRFYYDDFHKKFWRFSMDLDKKIGDSAVLKEVVTLFDENLNQLHEEVIPIPHFGFKFFKDGKLYSYVNVEDELCFVVFTFNF